MYWSILTHLDSFLAVLAQDSLTAVNLVTLSWWTLFLAPPAYKVLPSIYLNHPLPWSKAAKRSRSMFDAWDSSQKLRLGRGRFTQALHGHFYWCFLSLSSVMPQSFDFIWLIFVFQVNYWHFKLQIRIQSSIVIGRHYLGSKTLAVRALLPTLEALKVPPIIC